MPRLLLVSVLLLGCTGRIEDAPRGGSGATPWDRRHPSGALSDPGRVVLRRLNRTEYNNTVHDLLGTSLRPADDFPLDDPGFGFDNVASALTLSPTHFELLERAAIALVEEALGSSARARLMTCTPDEVGQDACARQIFAGFARRAWRRPATDAELARLGALVGIAEANGSGFEEGIALGLEAILVSPHFVYLVEIDPEPTSEAPHPLGDDELAARLSYFLWSTMPDDALFEAAGAGTLQDDEELEAQAVRMLADDDKARALVENFAGQWLYTRALRDHIVDRTIFPDFDDALFTSMRTETELFFQAFLDEARPVEELLTADFAFVDDRLAAHYGLAPVGGGGAFERVPITDGLRGGLLRQASVLTVTSHPGRTSPVRRGKWVLEQLLCTTVPDPPADVPTLESQTELTGTLRERMEQHRSNRSCATCHELMDPIGFGLETYDAVGAYRTMDGDGVIDSTGVLPDGQTFAGAEELSGLIVGDPRFMHCVVQKMLTYALGRGLTSESDQAWIGEIERRFDARGRTLRALVLSIVTSEPFRMRRGQAVEGGEP